MEYTVLCMKWGDKYPAEYVNRLYGMVSRHLSLPFRMLCLTDNSQGISKEVTCLPIPDLPLPEGLPERGWKKLTVFNDDLYGLSGQVLFLDLDIVIVDNIDSFFCTQDGLHIIHDWKRPWRITGNSSVFHFTFGQFPGLLPYFSEHFDALRKKFRNEQAYLSWYVHTQGALNYWPNSWCKSFKYHCMKNFPLSLCSSPRCPSDAKIIVFHGEITPADAISGTGGKWYRYLLASPWIAEKWQ